MRICQRNMRPANRFGVENSPKPLAANFRCRARAGCSFRIHYVCVCVSQRQTLWGNVAVSSRTVNMNSRTKYEKKTPLLNTPATDIRIHIPASHTLDDSTHIHIFSLASYRKGAAFLVSYKTYTLTAHGSRDAHSAIASHNEESFEPKSCALLTVCTLVHTSTYGSEADKYRGCAPTHIRQ